MLVVLGWLVIALLVPVLGLRDPLGQGPRLLEPPSGFDLFGTDQLGRDVASRVFWGARISLPIAALVVAVSLLIGVTLGSVAGYMGGWLDALLMRGTDLVFAFPAIILAMALTAVLKPGLTTAVIAIITISWPAYGRLARALVRSAARSDYVVAARLLGGGPVRSLLVDIMPNIAGPVLVLAMLDVGNVILLLSALSFLGLGAQPPVPEWGSMVSDGSQYFGQWWLATFPGLAIFTAVLGFNFVGDGIRDILDPRSTTNWVAVSERDPS
jgi:peptide/nickel transport system permease protein